MKTLIAIPCMDSIPYRFAESLLGLEGKTNIIFKPNSLIYDSRNLLSLTAIERKFDSVMWFDSDMTFKPDTMRRLQADMEELRADMVTGLYFKRVPGTLPVIYDDLKEPEVIQDETGVHPVKHIHEYADYPQDNIFPVKGCGFGCVMTSTRLLKEVWDKFGPAFMPYPWAGEDISFCHRVNLLGHTIYCDSGVKCGHVGTYVYSEQTFQEERGDVH